MPITSTPPFPAPRHLAIRSRRVLASLLWIAVLLGGPTVRSGEVTLQWKNGDSLAGTLLGGDGQMLRWQANGFTDPFDLRIDQLRHLAFPEPESRSSRTPGDDFLFLLRNGDRIFGNLVAIDGEFVVLRSGRFFEPLRLPRSEVIRIEKTRGGRTRLTGPFDLDHWISKGRNRKISEWQAGLRREFATHQWNADLFRSIAFP